MTRNHVFVLTAALALALALGPAGCGGKGDEPKGARKGAVSKSKIKGGPGLMRRALRKAPKPRLPDGGVAPARGASAATPPELIGLWEKTDLPGRGMRIEFTPTGGLAQVKIETPPPNAAEDIAFFTERANGNAEKGKKNADCFAGWWPEGAIKYGRLMQTGPSRWSASESVQAIIAAMSDCSRSFTRFIQVELKLDGEGRLISTRVTNEAAKTPAAPTAIWKRVVPEGAPGEKPVETKAIGKKVGRKSGGKAAAQKE